MAYRTTLRRENAAATKIRMTIRISALQFIDTMSNVSAICAALILCNDAAVVCEFTTISIPLTSKKEQVLAMNW